MEHQMIVDPLNPLPPKKMPAEESQLPVGKSVHSWPNMKWSVFFPPRDISDSVANPAVLVRGSKWVASGVNVSFKCCSYMQLVFLPCLHVFFPGKPARNFAADFQRQPTSWVSFSESPASLQTRHSNHANAHKRLGPKGSTSLGPRDCLDWGKQWT